MSDPSIESAGPPSEETPPLRGLWRLMGGGKAQGAAVADKSPEPESDQSADGERSRPTAATAGNPPAASALAASGAPEAPRGKGLWGVMRGGPSSESETPKESATATVLRGPIDVPLPRDEEIAELNSATAGASHESAAGERDTTGGILVSDSPFPAFPEPVTAPRPTRGSLQCLAAGIGSLVLSSLAILPAVWTRFPATIAGFASLLLGMTAWGEIARSRGRKRGRELILAGAACGVAGMFLGPLAFGPLGTRWRESSGQTFTRHHLESMGTALDQYYEAKGHYPAGSILAPDERGADRAIQGWMTSLLPYLGEATLYQSIDLSRPWNAPENLPAMRRVVPAFLAAGASTEPVGEGMAPAHFAGVGGELSIPGQGLVHLGLFAPGSSVRRTDVVDGLGNTLVAGEIVQLYPPWGEPENWRSIGKGLNVQPRGFGNLENTGALFLKADGSVQFFSNKTSPELLERLSTRDGGEVVGEPASR